MNARPEVIFKSCKLFSPFLNECLMAPVLYSRLLSAIGCPRILKLLTPVSGEIFGHNRSKP